jgi:hypothetical protein
MAGTKLTGQPTRIKEVRWANPGKGAMAAKTKKSGAKKSGAKKSSAKKPGHKTGHKPRAMNPKKPGHDGRPKNAASRGQRHSRRRNPEGSILKAMAWGAGGRLIGGVGSELADMASGRMKGIGKALIRAAGAASPALVGKMIEDTHRDGALALAGAGGAGLLGEVGKGMAHRGHGRPPGWARWFGFHHELPCEGGGSLTHHEGTVSYHPPPLADGTEPPSVRMMPLGAGGGGGADRTGMAGLNVLSDLNIEQNGQTHAVKVIGMLPGGVAFVHPKTKKVGVAFQSEGESWADSEESLRDLVQMHGIVKLDDLVQMHGEHEEEEEEQLGELGELGELAGLVQISGEETDEEIADLVQMHGPSSSGTMRSTYSSR